VVIFIKEITLRICALRVRCINRRNQGYFLSKLKDNRVIHHCWEDENKKEGNTSFFASPGNMWFMNIKITRPPYLYESSSHIPSYF